jgi:large repetitive protein
VDVTGPITNVAQVNHNEHFDIDSTPDNDDPGEDDQDEVVIDAQPLVDVELDKTVDKAEADPFENVVWTVTVTNKGPSAATGLTVSDPLPTNWVYVSDSSGAYDTNTGIWTIGTLAAGGSTQLQLTAYATLGVTVMGHGPVPPAYTNVAQVWTLNEDDVDSTPGNSDPAEDDQDDASIPIRALSDLALTKTVDNATPYLGSQIAYTVVVTNEGPQPAVGVLIEDMLPAGLTYVSNSVGAAYSPGRRHLGHRLYASPGSRTLTIWATVD